MITSTELYNQWGNPYTTKDEGKYMVAWKVPQYIWENIPEIPRRIYCNYQMIVPLEVAFLNVIDRGLAQQVETWDGCFNVRPKRLYESIVEAYLETGLIAKAMEYMSTHSWGVSIDVNQARNQLGKKPTMSPEFVQCFIDAGFDWGGLWDRPDGMHFQLAYLTKEW